MVKLQSYPPIWFLRHGQTEWNRAFRLQGQMDSPLTEQGIAEAKAQAALIGPILLRSPAVAVSPLGRTRQTADIVLGGREYATDPRLMEIDAGAWQGRLRNEILVERPDLAQTSPTALQIYQAAPDGEGLERFHNRIAAFLEDLTGPTVIIAHGLLGQVLRAQVCGLSLDAAGHLPNLQGCIYHLEKGQEHILAGAT